MRQSSFNLIVAGLGVLSLMVIASCGGSKRGKGPEKDPKAAVERINEAKCQEDADCPEGLVCQFEECTTANDGSEPECLKNSDCPEGQICQATPLASSSSAFAGPGYGAGYGSGWSWTCISPPPPPAPDVTPPTVTSVTPLDSKTIEITFSEAVDFDSIVPLGTVWVMTQTPTGPYRRGGSVRKVDEANPTTIRFVSIHPMVTVRYLAGHANAGEVYPWRYELIVSGGSDNPNAVKDMAGNVMTETYHHFLYCGDLPGSIPCDFIGR